MQLGMCVPDWPLPSWVRACYTNRLGGVSQVPFDSFNLGDHVDDLAASVESNRNRLAQAIGSTPIWLQQIHSTKSIYLDHNSPHGISADASWTDQAGVACAVMTADCLPLLAVDHSSRRVAAIHAGWRGLLDGVIEQTLSYMQASTEHTSIWMGACIGVEAFQVGEEVREQFIRFDKASAKHFKDDSQAQGKFFADLKGLAQMRLHNMGIRAISSLEACTFKDKSQFFSYRRDGQTGRQASLIWIENNLT